jgi:hypothetical protein
LNSVSSDDPYEREANVCSTLARRRYAGALPQKFADSGVLSIKMTRQLQARSKNVDPFRLKVQLEYAQRTLAARAVRSDSYVRQASAAVES